MKTAMQQLKDKLLEEVERLSDAQPLTDQYGYREALKNISNDIDAQMLELERQQIIDAVNANEEKATRQANFWIKKVSKKKVDLLDPIEDAGEQYYNTTFSK